MESAKVHNLVRTLRTLPPPVLTSSGEARMEGQRAVHILLE